MARTKGCEHTPYDWPCQDCVVLTPEQRAYGERLRSVGFQYTYGRDQFHGPTLREQQQEIIDGAARIGNPTPEPVGTRWV